jgi:hypothetical protein
MVRATCRRTLVVCIEGSGHEKTTRSHLAVQTGCETKCQAAKLRLTRIRAASFQLQASNVHTSANLLRRLLDGCRIPAHAHTSACRSHDLRNNARIDEAVGNNEGHTRIVPFKLYNAFLSRRLCHIPSPVDSVTSELACWTCC